MRRRALACGLALSCTALGAAPVSRTVAPGTHLRTFAFCPDGKTLVGPEGQSGWLISWPAGDARRPAPGTDASRPPCAAASLGYSTDGKSWAFPADDDSGEVVVRDGAGGAETKRFRAHLGSVVAVLFSPDGRFLATSGDDNDVHIWDAKTWAAVKTIDSISFTSFALAWRRSFSMKAVAMSIR